MAIQVAPAVAELVAGLRAAGLRADVDPEALTADPACVWVQPRAVESLNLAGGGRLLVWLYVIVVNVEPLTALALLDDALTAVLELADDLADDGAPIDLAAAVALPSSSVPLPAYRVAVTLDL